MKCIHCHKKLKNKKSTARYCDNACRQAAYRERRAAQPWHPGDTAIAQNYVVTIGSANEEFAAVRIQYTLARVADEKAAVWHKVPVSKLKSLQTLKAS